jgi:hypothetical protein
LCAQRLHEESEGGIEGQSHASAGASPSWPTARSRCIPTQPTASTMKCRRPSSRPAWASD